MPRPPAPPERSEVAADEVSAYDSVLTRYRKPDGSPPDLAEVTPYFQVLLNTPPFAAALAHLGTLIRATGDRPDTYSHIDREYVDQVMSAQLRTNVVQAIHVPDAVSTGVRLDAIEALRAGNDAALTQDELLVAKYIRDVVTGSVTDELFREMEERLSARGVVEYTIYIGFLLMVIRLYQAFGLSDPSDEEIDRLIVDIRTGRAELPDYRLHIR